MSIYLPESAEELRVQGKRVASMSESMNDLSSKINLLLPALVESVSSHRLRNSAGVVSVDSLDLGEFEMKCNSYSILDCFVLKKI